MMRSMFSGVSGLKNHQVRMDVIGNNIANVNTIGFKKSRVTFQDMLNQNLRGASSPQGIRGGTNAQQVGLGVTLSSIDNDHSQGSLQNTGKMTDLAVQGDGYFIVAEGESLYYTRAGNFDLDAVGNIVIKSNGMIVRGWVADASGVIDTNTPMTNLNIPVGLAIQPIATTSVEYSNNLDSRVAVGATRTVPIIAYDSLGTEFTINIELEKTAANTWNVEYPSGTVVGAITFNPDGSFNAGSPVNISVAHTNGSTTPQAIALDLDSLTQYAADYTVEATYQDGGSTGTLQTFSIDTTGVITGVFSNGLTKELAQIGVANFNNPSGLVKMGENLYKPSNNSGLAQAGAAGVNGRGTIAPGTLEMSNVDLALEFTEMIVTQRGFQANARIITVSDELLQELVNLKR